jgi:hypothetical protein
MRFLVAIAGLWVGCSGGPTEPILRGASWDLSGTRTAATVSWIDRHGQSVQGQAVSGEVALLIDPLRNSADAVAAMVTQHGGTVFAQLPAVGLYWARVQPGGEGSFIAAVRSSVDDAFPNLMRVSHELTPPLHFSDSGQSAPLPVSSGNLILDDFRTPMCLNCDADGNPPNGQAPIYLLKDADGNLIRDINGNFVETNDPTMAAAHGDVTNFFRTTACGVDDPGASSHIDGLQDPSLASDFVSFAGMIAGADSLGTPAIINYSAGPDDSNLPSGSVQSVNQGFIESFAGLLNSNVSGADNALLVQAASNTGTDYGSILVEEQTLHPTASKQIIEVGSLDARGQITVGTAYSTTPGTMIYVPVTAMTDHGHAILGNSFAAPQIQCLVNKLHEARPDLTPDQLQQVLFDSSVAPMRSVQQPDAPIGQTMMVPSITDPYSPTVLAAAVNVANMKFPPPTSGGTTGSGGGYDCSGMYGEAAGSGGDCVCVITAHCECQGTSVSCWYQGSDGYMTSKCSFDATDSASTNAYASCVEGIANAVGQHCCPPPP